MTPTSVLARYVGDVAAFLADYWDRAVFHRPSPDGTAFDELVTVADVDRLISSALAHHPDVHLVKDGQQVDPSQFSYPPDPRRGGARVIDAARVYECFHAGATIQMQGIHFRHAPLAAFCRQLELELAVPVQANMYITPPHSRGLSLHADRHDVLVLQVSGTKHWRIYERVPAGTDLHDAALEPALILDTELSAGDVLYVPRGIPHEVESTTTSSIHLTVGFVSPSFGEAIGDLVSDLLAAIGSEPRFQAPLPAGAFGAPASLAPALGERLRELAARVASLDAGEAAAHLAHRFWAERSPILEGQLAELMALPALSRQSVLRRRPASIARVSQIEEALTLTLGDRSLQMPTRLGPALDYILGRPQFALAELDPFLDESSQLVLVRRLVREGLLMQARPLPAPAGRR
jgi:bifunctional lysine-specific demethylase and histidyl-hydroxylase NO66